jgi:hypothetical protein
MLNIIMLSVVVLSVVMLNVVAPLLQKSVNYGRKKFYSTSPMVHFHLFSVVPQLAMELIKQCRGIQIILTEEEGSDFLIVVACLIKYKIFSL